MGHGILASWPHMSFGQHCCEVVSQSWKQDCCMDKIEEEWCRGRVGRKCDRTKDVHCGMWALLGEAGASFPTAFPPRTFLYSYNLQWAWFPDVHYHSEMDFIPKLTKQLPCTLSLESSRRQGIFIYRLLAYLINKVCTKEVVSWQSSWV